ncbi:unnamed protein product [Cylicocyclus nassatus]|uniref:Uncharacterized protein n=1 Tax=Cylicocyclus nassatus TaxID=53992 RepID=A0AA36GQ79_CYLNA|nr:unnamed protein product [Cylicocyclus nassatus]
MLACAIAAASGIALYYYCRDDEEKMADIVYGPGYMVPSGTAVSRDHYSDTIDMDQHLHHMHRPRRIWRSENPERVSRITRTSTEMKSRKMSTETPLREESYDRERQGLRYTSGLDQPIYCTCGMNKNNYNQYGYNQRNTSGLDQPAYCTCGMNKNDYNQYGYNQRNVRSNTRTAREISSTRTGRRMSSTKTGMLPSDADGRRRVTRESYTRNVQRTTASTDPAALDNPQSASVRLIPVQIDNPDVHNVTGSVDRKFLDGRHVKVVKKNEEIMKESVN